MSSTPHPCDSNGKARLRTTALKLIVFLIRDTLGLPYYATCVFKQESTIEAKELKAKIYLICSTSIPGDSESVGMR